MTQIPLQTPSIILCGPPGTGKTHACVTLAKAGIEVFSIITEPGGVESIIDAAAKEGVPLDKFHWVYTPPAVAG